MAKRRSFDCRMSSIFDSDETIADFIAIDLGVITKCGEYYGIGGCDFEAEDLLDSPELMSALISRWTLSNLIDMFEDMREGLDLDEMASPRIISTAILQTELKHHEFLIGDQK